MREIDFFQKLIKIYENYYFLNKIMLDIIICILKI